VASKKLLSLLLFCVAADAAANGGQDGGRSVGYTTETMASWLTDIEPAAIYEY
jgi:hypothetical protein